MPRSPAKKNTAVPTEKDELENKRFHLEIQKLRLEEDKCWFEFHKHMTTLNTGVIIIVATLVEKVFTNIDKAGLGIIGMAFYAFLGSITVSALGLGYHMPSLRLTRVKDVTRKSVSLVYLLTYAKIILFLASLLGFLLGIFFFIAFALRNTQ
jgi:hypothetical protein